MNCPEKSQKNFLSGAYLMCIGGDEQSSFTYQSFGVGDRKSEEKPPGYHPNFPPKVCSFKNDGIGNESKRQLSALAFGEFYKFWRILIIYSKAYRGSESMYYRAQLENS